MSTKTKVQFKRKVDDGWDKVSPLTETDCVFLEDGTTLDELLDNVIFVGDSGDEPIGLITKDDREVLTKGGLPIELKGANGSTTISELEEKLVISDNDVFIVEDAYFTRKVTKATLLREVNEKFSALESRFDEIDNSMNPLTISLSMSPTTAEKGNVITSIKFNWSYNRDIRSQTFENELLDVNLRSLTYTSPVDNNKTFTLVAESLSGQTKTQKSSIGFLNGIYYGVSSLETYDNEFILSLTKVLSDSRSRTIKVNAGTEDYIFYCLPKRLGDCTFSVGGFVGGFSKVKTLEFTNTYGYTESYDIWKSDNKGLGETQVVIS